jgi:hypothetical protein
MADIKDPAASAVSENWVQITSVYAGDCIPLSAVITVSYSNANLAAGTVGLGCQGALAPPDQPAPIGTTGSMSFRVSHRSVAAGHAITATLKNAGAAVTSDSVSPVSIGNPCSIIITGLQDVVRGFYTLDATAPLAGTFDRSKGNEVLLLVDQPGAAEGEYAPAPLLVYADPAEVDVGAGAWTHPAIKVAKKGMLLRVVLSKDGEVKTTVRAMFA